MASREDIEPIVASVATWHGRWHGMLLHVLSKRLAGREDIQDLAQEVYLRMLRVKKPDLIEHPKAYLYRVAVNVAEEWRLRAQQALVHGPDGLEALESPDNPMEKAESSQRDQAVLEALSALPLAWRTAVSLNVLDGMTYDEVAAHMGVSRRMVKRYIGKGYAELRERISLVLRVPKV